MTYGKTKSQPMTPNIRVIANNKLLNNGATHNPSGYRQIRVWSGKGEWRIKL